MSDQMTPDERRAVDFLLAGQDPILEALRHQASVASISKRRFTGHGFFTDFDVPEAIPAFEPAEFELGDVVCSVNDHRCGLIVFIRNGVLGFLECYLLADGEIQDPVKIEDLHYVRDGKPSQERDLDGLRRSWGREDRES